MLADSADLPRSHEQQAWGERVGVWRQDPLWLTWKTAGMEGELTGWSGDDVKSLMGYQNTPEVGQSAPAGLCWVWRGGQKTSAKPQLRNEEHGFRMTRV